MASYASNLQTAQQVMPAAWWGGVPLGTPNPGAQLLVEAGEAALELAEARLAERVVPATGPAQHPRVALDVGHPALLALGVADDQEQLLARALDLLQAHLAGLEAAQLVVRGLLDHVHVQQQRVAEGTRSRDVLAQEGGQRVLA